ncbi:hypothetical protein AMAG_17714 [Allomyces macrogynus ATCC 38327]|uniref:Uncharacterized protein n=1 Tax=Allomyces macrogynus (strain ATCC 38327) TaxID=578462 RepID=A0A0L0RXJ8_ALLM3|nr:hypothetical protein AMAG_17714 [Allomyces macrogynus ATCC 38327]|eukprot:KNE54875.1 hypothetical protein AMAG_17714 [Allomyces macrogynus ATCC 38327]
MKLNGCTVVQPSVQWRVRLESTDAPADAAATASHVDVNMSDTMAVITMHSQLVDAFPTFSRTWSVKAEYMVPSGAAFVKDRVVLFIHGSADCLGSAPDYHEFVASLCVRIRRRIFNV